MINFIFILRALTPPGWLKRWHIGVRVKKNKKLVGFISAIPADLRSYNKYGIHLSLIGCKTSISIGCG